MEMKPGDKYCPIATNPFEIDRMCKKEKCAWYIKFYLGKKLVRSGCAICFIAIQEIPKGISKKEET